MQEFVYEIKAHGSTKTKDGRSMNDCFPYFCFSRQTSFFQPSLENTEHMPISDSLLSVQPKLDEGGILTAVEIRSHNPFFGPTEADFCKALQTDLDNFFAIKLDGGLELQRIEGELPKTLYHLTSEEKLEQIRKEGLVPGIGENSLKEDFEKYVYLCEKDKLAVWMGRLPYMDAPVVLEIDCDGLAIEPGRRFEDEDSIMTEIRTRQAVWPKQIKEADLSKDGELYQAIADGLLNVNIEDRVDGEERLAIAAAAYEMRKADLEFAGSIDNLGAGNVLIK